MRFATRTFLGSFVPFAILLALSFWGVRAAVGVAVRDRLRASVRDSEMAVTREHARNESRMRRMLGGVAENPALKAGLQLLTAEPESQELARNTVRDQLSEIGDGLDFDLMLISRADGDPLAAVVREAGGFAPLERSSILRSGVRMPERGYFALDERLYEVTSVPIHQGDEQVATLTVGARFDISLLGIPAVLLRRGNVVAAQMRDLAPAVIETALRDCPGNAECQPRIQNQTHLSLPLNSPAGDYVLRSLQNVDAAAAPVQAALQKLFVIAALLALAAALGISVFTSRSVAKPLAEVAAHLRRSSASGELTEIPENRAYGLEIRELTRGFNQAAKSVRESRDQLTSAYVEFVGSMAQALDARDAYTAGHSRRVSEYACAIGKAIGLSTHEIETIRVGALLHDLGKIGISDAVLQKPGKLTSEEETLIRRHPVIGRRILEKVHGMEPYLAMVELHHENWDGTGYPRGLKQEETPLHARIVKVADAYDAMTSDRPYRRGRSHAEALAVLRKIAGTETDVILVDAFGGLGDLVKEQEVKLQAARQRSEEPAVSLQNLGGALEAEGAKQPSPVL